MISGHVKTQLIAHDKEVYDIAFSRAGGVRDMFASVVKFYFIVLSVNVVYRFYTYAWYLVMLKQSTQ